MITDKETLKQFVRYVTVGLASNLALYALYLCLTGIGLGPKLSMSLLYILGVLQTFYFNKSWSFQFEGEAIPALLRYVIVYVIGYLINYLSLLVLVDQLGVSDQVVMGGLIVFMAIFFFVAQRTWVFRHTDKPQVE